MAGIPSGMQMMLKSMGIDPLEIVKSIESFKLLADKMAETQLSIDKRLSMLHGILDSTVSLNFLLQEINNRLIVIEGLQREILTHVSGVDQTPMPDDWPEYDLGQVKAFEPSNEQLGIPAEV